MANSNFSCNLLIFIPVLVSSFLRVSLPVFRITTSFQLPGFYLPFLLGVHVSAAYTLKEVFYISFLNVFDSVMFQIIL
jgi:hypothetical protein